MKCAEFGEKQFPAKGSKGSPDFRNYRLYPSSESHHWRNPKPGPY